MRERDIQAKVVGYARARRVIARKLDFGEGWPDYMFLYAGRILFMEFKGAGGRIRPLQQHIHKVLKSAEFEVLLIDSVAEGEAEIDDFVAVVPKRETVVDYADIIKPKVAHR